jgi:hypothetical protein
MSTEYEVRVTLRAKSRAEAEQLFDAIVDAAPDHEGAMLIRPRRECASPFPVPESVKL